MSDLRDPKTMVNLDRYPIDRLDSPECQAVIEKVKADLDRDGTASMPEFLRPEAITLMAEEATILAPLAYKGPTEVTPYFFNYDLANIDDPHHPTKRLTKRDLSQVAYDLIPPESALYRLYHWDAVPAFLARILGFDQLYRTSDPYQALNVSVMREGGCQQWHFDSSKFVTTLMAQASEGGGEFHYVPNLREDDDEHYDDVKAILDGDHSRVRKVVIAPGMLNLFRGHYSMHRVTEVTGPRPRLQMILAYSPNPDAKGSLKSSVMHYGARVGIRSGLSPAEIKEILPA